MRSLVPVLEQLRWFRVHLSSNCAGLGGASRTIAGLGCNCFSFFSSSFISCIGCLKWSPPRGAKKVNETLPGDAFPDGNLTTSQTRFFLIDGSGFPFWFRVNLSSNCAGLGYTSRAVALVQGALLERLRWFRVHLSSICAGLGCTSRTIALV